MKAKKRIRRTFDSQEKLRAILSIWTERRSATEVCKEMSISWTLLDRWQNLAMEGMVKALQPGKPEKSKPLNTRLEKLIEKKMNVPLMKLEKRLKTIQQAKPN